MDDPIARGHAFVVGDLWRSPSFPGAGEQHDSIFEALDTSSTRLHLPKSEEEAPHFTFDTDLPELPALDVAAAPLESTPLPSPEENDLDVWNLDHASVDLPRVSDLCTWEAFDGKSVANSQHTAILSEAGQSAFDALDNTARKEGVLPQDYTLRALCSLAHGRSSTLFHWSDEDGRFLLVLQGTAISGISQLCAESLTKDMIEMGTSIVRLRQFGDTAYSSQKACPAMVAMRNGVASVLDAVDEIICGEASAVCSLLQLQQLVKRPCQLLSVLDTLVDSVRDCKTDESLISAISDGIHMLSLSNHEYSAVFRALLARVSVPWLERLSTDIGLCLVAPALPDASCDLQSVDDFTKDTHAFLDDIDIELIHETKTAVALLRELSPNHPLLGSELHATVSPFESFTNPTLSLQQTSQSAKLYETQVMRHMGGKGPPKPVISAEMPLDPGYVESWQDEVSRESYITGLCGLMSQNIDMKPAATPDELYALVAVACQTFPVDEDRGSDLFTCESSTPLERVRPFIKTQHRLVNGILLRQLLRDHDLGQHLEKQKQFQLFGSGDFLTRLSTALFSLDVQSAERKRGVIPTGEIMGLRLGSSPEQRWPPASSELRLTLAGVLEESQGLRPSISESQGGRVGALSFAIRELPEAEIDRVLDVHSVHALDFLRLQYVPAPPLDAIFTPEAIQQYDAVFRFLLKLLRQIHVVKSLPRKAFGRRSDAGSGDIITFANESHHFVSILTAHSMEVGINAPWQALMTSIKQLELALKDEDIAREIGTKAAVGIKGLRQLHELCLDRMRNRLLLKRKHAKLRNATEAVFTAILKSAAVLSATGALDQSAFEEQYVLFKQACLQLCEMLQQVVEKPPRAMTAAESEDADTLRLLLLKLDWNGFYSSA